MSRPVSPETSAFTAFSSKSPQVPQMTSSFAPTLSAMYSLTASSTAVSSDTLLPWNMIVMVGRSSACAKEHRERIRARERIRLTSLRILGSSFYFSELYSSKFHPFALLTIGSATILNRCRRGLGGRSESPPSSFHTSYRQPRDHKPLEERIGAGNRQHDEHHQCHLQRLGRQRHRRL